MAQPEAARSAAGRADAQGLGAADAERLRGQVGPNEMPEEWRSVLLEPGRISGTRAGS